MNKVKMFFVAAALVLTTAGVFAGKAKFVNDPASNVYYYNSVSGQYALIGTGTASATTLVYNGSGTVARIQGTGGTSYPLYSFVSGAFTQLYTTGF